MHVTAKIKKTQQQKPFDIKNQFQHLMAFPNDMIHALVNNQNHFGFVVSELQLDPLNYSPIVV